MSGVAPVPVTVAVLTMVVPASSSACVTVMAGRVLPGLADIQQTVLVGVADIEGAVKYRRLVGRERVVHHHIGNRRIALVGHRQRVVDDSLVEFAVPSATVASFSMCRICPSVADPE